MNRYRDVAPVAAQISALQLEFERDFEQFSSTSLVATHSDGSRSRWRFIVDADAPHRISGQMWWTGPLPAYTDQMIPGSAADVLARDYDATGPGPEHLVLLHGFGGDVGSWDMVVPHIQPRSSSRD